MSLNEEKTEKTHHDNNSYCSKNHTCIDCKYKKELFGEEPCDVCIGINKHNKICKWKHE